MEVKYENSGPLVSVLISTYNRPMYVAEAIESILCQTYTNFEILLVRDGGEPVRDVISQFDDPRLTFIDRDENMGLPYSFNEVLRIAKGKYICYLGDDDKYYPNHIEVLVGALEGQERYGVAYSDLYRVPCRIEEDGSRTVLSKNVEVSRDFDMAMLLHFNNILGVSFMHRRDLLEKTGLYNEDINVMIDWDMTRRMAFFTELKHVNDVTGEYYTAIENSDRISHKRRKNASNYLWNLLTIRSTRPAKPWDKLEDISIVVLSERLDAQTIQQLLDIWSHSFYPYQIYLPATAEELESLRTPVSNVIGVEVSASSSPEERFDAALKVCQGDYVAVVAKDIDLKGKDVGWVENSLWPLIASDDANQAFEIIKSEPGYWSAVFGCEQIKRARREFGHLSIEESVKAAGIKLRKPEPDEIPSRFDNAIVAVEGLEEKGDWKYALKIFDYIIGTFDGNIWVKTRYANAFYHAGQYAGALRLIKEINSSRATVSSLLIEARVHNAMSNKQKAIEFYSRAEAILDGSEFAMAG
ncbi:MAG: glycosyltransferase [Planctomycetes bacterium]|nr:glycosyltransferase [Planctomycetota bacterium]